MKYYISDLHLGDTLVFKLCGREITIEQFNDLIINNWNRVVQEDDEVYILGDLANEEYKDCIICLRQLYGNKHLIIGNHDIELLEDEAFRIQLQKIMSIKHEDLIEDSGRLVFLSHYLLLDWSECHRGSYLIYGRIHNKSIPEIKSFYNYKPAFNASTDVTGFIPQTLDELM